MPENKVRAEITAEGVVQGVGFRYFVFRNAVSLGLKGYTTNKMSGDTVLTVVEGTRSQIEHLYRMIESGPKFAIVEKCDIKWLDNQDEFSTFDIKHEW